MNMNIEEIEFELNRRLELINTLLKENAELQAKAVENEKVFVAATSTWGEQRIAFLARIRKLEEALQEISPIAENVNKNISTLQFLPTWYRNLTVNLLESIKKLATKALEEK